MPDHTKATKGRSSLDMLAHAEISSAATEARERGSNLQKTHSANYFETSSQSDSSLPASLNKKRFSLAEKRGSIAEEMRHLKSRASQLIIHVPVQNLKKIANTTGMNSLSRETQYFCGICTMHGPLRVYRGKNYSRLFWSIMVSVNAFLLIWQNSMLIKQYFAKPTASQVYFMLPEDGIPFPSLTVCSFNYVRKSYVEKLNETGDFSYQLLDYIKQLYVEVETFYTNAKLSELEQGLMEYLNFTSVPEHRNFSFELFYNESGFPCEELFKICTFGGRRFNCCEQMRPILTDLGRCYLMQLSDSSDPYLRKQTQSGINSGLQIIADFHTEELMDSDAGNDPLPFLSNGFENGFRYFIHGVDEISYLSHEGISVSPGYIINSAIGPNEFLLLDETEWGNCTGSWPKGYNSHRLYSSAKCKALCRARYFNEHCGCSPYFYNIDHEYRICSPYETYVCIYDKLTNHSKDFVPPKCLECKMECERWVYHTYNSYGHGYSNDALSWLRSQNPKWTPAHVRMNFVIMNIAYMDMSYTVYSQVQSTSLTQILSNIGGNMGLFLGISVLSCAEIIMYVAKMTWIMISRKRRQHLIFKKEEEEERERRLKETIEAVHRKSSMPEPPPMRKMSTIDRFKRFGSQIAKYAWKASFRRELPDGEHEDLADERRSRRAEFFDSFVENRLYNSGPIDTFASRSTDSPHNDQVLELKIDLNELYRQRSPSLPVPCQITTVPHSAMFVKRRSSSNPLENQNIQNSVPERRSPVLGARNWNRSAFLDDYLEVPEKINEVDEESGEGGVSLAQPSPIPNGSLKLGKQKEHGSVHFMLPSGDQDEEQVKGSQESIKKSEFSDDATKDFLECTEAPSFRKQITPDEVRYSPSNSQASLFEGKIQAESDDDSDNNDDNKTVLSHRNSQSDSDILDMLRSEDMPLRRKFGSIQ